jgi:hypothetical protein
VVVNRANGKKGIQMQIGKLGFSIFLKGTQARDFVVRFSHFLASFNTREAKVQNFKKNFFIKCKILIHNRIVAITRYRRKRTISLPLFGKNALFHSTYSPKTHNSAFSLNTLYTAKRAQFYSSFSPTTISLTPRFCLKCEV